VRERFFGTFERDITLPEGLDPDSISASYDGGILTIRMPLPRQLDTKARRIPVVATEQKAIEAEATELIRRVIRRVLIRRVLIRPPQATTGGGSTPPPVPRHSRASSNPAAKSCAAAAS
jgi:hypothetical protein